MCAAPAKSGPKELYEIRILVRGGTAADGREYGDHAEIYRPEGTPDRVCKVCGRDIPAGWAPALERIRQQSGKFLMACSIFEVDTETGDRTLKDNKVIPANLAKDFLEKGRDVFDIRGPLAAFLEANTTRAKLAEQQAKGGGIK